MLTVVSNLTKSNNTPSKLLKSFESDFWKHKSFGHTTLVGDQAFLNSRVFSSTDDQELDFKG